MSYLLDTHIFLWFAAGDSRYCRSVQEWPPPLSESPAMSRYGRYHLGEERSMVDANKHSSAFGDPTNEPEVLRFYPSRTKMVLFALGAAIGVAVGVWLATASLVLGGLSIAFWGLGFLVFIIQLLPNSSYLEIRSDGFTMRGLYRDHSYRWDDIQAFFPVSLHGNRMTAVTFRPEFEGHVWGRGMSQAIADCDGAIPEYGVPADKMAEILNECLARFRETEVSE